MGISLPFVGYVAATVHGETLDVPANMFNWLTVDNFVGQVRTAVFEGWSQQISPAGNYTADAAGRFGSLHDKNFVHDVAFETDLEERPELKRLVDFLKSNPAGGAICVVNLSHILGASHHVYSHEQCSSVGYVAEKPLPVVEIGNKDLSASLSYKLPRSYGDQTVFEAIVNNAMSNAPRIAKSYNSGAKRCTMWRAEFSELPVRQEAFGLEAANLLCGKCIQKLNVYRPVKPHSASKRPPEKSGRFAER